MRDGESPVDGRGEQAATPADVSTQRKIAAGTAVGIGSAAIVAALMFANRTRTKPAKVRVDG